MANLIFVTSNHNKANYLKKYLGFPVDHHKIDLDEIQSLDLKKVVEHKLLQAYAIIHKPILVEDVSLEFVALGRLPGTFIKFYVEEMSFETICRTLDGLSRKAIAKSIYGYYDGKQMKFFEGSLNGIIAEEPRGKNGWGWDKIFIPEGYSQTRAELSEEEDKKTYLKMEPFDKLKVFLENK